MLQFSVYKGNPYFSKFFKNHTVWGPPWWFSDLRIRWAVQHTWAQFLARELDPTFLRATKPACGNCTVHRPQRKILHDAMSIRKQTKN